MSFDTPRSSSLAFSPSHLRSPLDDRRESGMSAPLPTETYGDDPWSAGGSGSGQHKKGGLEVLMSEASLPPLYTRAFEAAEPHGTSVSMSSAYRVLATTKLGAIPVEKILSMVSNSSRISKLEFAVALALAAFAQEGKPVSIENVAANKDSLPSPSLDLPPTRSGSASGDPWGTHGAKLLLNGANSPSVPHPYSSGDDAGVGQEAGFAAPSLPPFDASKLDAIGVRLGSPEGWLLKHNVFFVDWEKRNCSVPRRYSDFVWLLDCLTKRYPFRLLPSLPPKRIAISGHHITAGDDAVFLERRRRGLRRFLTFLVNHPSLSVDALVVTFLTEPSDLATWRSHSPVHLIEEALTKRLTPTEEMAIPQDLDDKLGAFRTRLPLCLEHWTRVCAATERISRRREAQAADWTRVQLALGSAVESERVGAGGWRLEELRRTEEDAELMASHVGRHAEIMEGMGDKFAVGTCERLRAHRDLYVDFLALMYRHDRLSGDSVDRKLKPRVDSTLKRLDSIKNAGRPGAEEEVAKLINSIEEDRNTIEVLLRRRVFIRHCLWSELIWLMRLSTRLGISVREFVAEELGFAEREVGNWRLLGEALNA